MNSSPNRRIILALAGLVIIGMALFAAIFIALDKR